MGTFEVKQRLFLFAVSYADTVNVRLCFWVFIVCDDSVSSFAEFTAFKFLLIITVPSEVTWVIELF